MTKTRRSSPSSRPPPTGAVLTAVLGLLGTECGRCALADDASSFPFGYQSGDVLSFQDPATSGGPSDPYDRDSYPGGMVYDASSKLLYVTGGTYGNYFDVANSGGTGGIEEDASGAAGGGGGESDCFLAVLRLPDAEGGDGGGSGAVGGDDGVRRSVSPATGPPGGLRRLFGGPGGGATTEGLLQSWGRRLLSIQPRDAADSSALPPTPPQTPDLLHSLRVGTASSPEVCSSLAPFSPPSEGGGGV
eukprot:CAMPEP_0197466746 /NCGR_PEP_ID=MMETSP1175-20131217/65214_1 /TAXON_ID=1003142 /ORGANISM="Triceratium dubium, Strain CCMP147" /LENGTH=245 /DNA_ID=CAMNT_0043002799 /DNA_START=605 /DNA_END=1338 /DNA_ORIENTATION=+